MSATLKTLPQKSRNQIENQNQINDCVSLSNRLMFQLKSTRKLTFIKNGQKLKKISSRVGGGTIFEGQGGSKIDEKSMPKRFQDKISS